MPSVCEWFGFFYACTPGGATGGYANGRLTLRFDADTVGILGGFDFSVAGLVGFPFPTQTDLAPDRGRWTYLLGDSTPPSLTVPADLTVEATRPAGAVASFSATATDDVDPEPVVACEPVSGSMFELGETVVSCTATDDSGNSAPERSSSQSWTRQPR